MGREPGKNPMRFASSGFELVGVMLFFMGLGYLFDQWQDTKPWGVLAGATYGIVGGLYKLIRDVQNKGGDKS